MPGMVPAARDTADDQALNSAHLDHDIDIATPNGTPAIVNASGM